MNNEPLDEDEAQRQLEKIFWKRTNHGSDWWNAGCPGTFEEWLEEKRKWVFGDE